MNLEGISFLRLNQDHTFKSFDCKNELLNNFLLSKAKDHQAKLITVTYILEDNSRTVAFFSLLNDRITVTDATSNTQWRKRFRDIMPMGKRYDSYPAVKIGRLGVNQHLKMNGVGKSIIDYIKVSFTDSNKTGCRFITVDALTESIGFYTKCGFDFLTNKDEKDLHSRQMYFDLALMKTTNN